MFSASRAAAAAMRDGRAVNAFAAHTFAGPAGMRRRAKQFRMRAGLSPCLGYLLDSRYTNLRWKRKPAQ
jgi:hypothetical protein